MPRRSRPRGSTPCFNCRRKRHRCSKDRPECRACCRTRVACTYPDQAFFTGFMYLESPRHFISSLQRCVTSSAFLHLTRDELGAIQNITKPCAVYDEHTHVDYKERPLVIGESWWEEAKRKHETLSIHPSMLLDLGNGPQTLKSIESSLLQYYDEVISGSWVYDPADVNMFRSAVMPCLLQTSGPLLLIVLAISASEWDQSCQDASMSYSQMSLSFKGRALKELQSRLHIAQAAENNLLTCVLLSCLGINTGEASWIQHFQGAFALVEIFGSIIDPSIADFAIQYYHTRYTLAKTAKSSHQADKVSNHAIRSVVLDPNIQSRLEKQIIDPYIGCPVRLLRVIDQISQLSSRIGHENKSGQQFIAEAQSLADEIHQMTSSDSNSYSDSLRTIVEAFQLASWLYLQMTCFNAPITEPWIIEGQNRLSLHLSRTITDGERRLFPMWPLFIAGCACSSDEQRVVILDLFSRLVAQWPTRNIATVSRALWTIWQVRDHVQLQNLPRAENWQYILDQFGWKLPLV